MFLHYCMHMRTCAAERHKQAANYWGWGPAPTREVGDLFSPRVVSDSQPWKRKEGRRIVSLKPFFSWHREAKREGVLSDHKSCDYPSVFPPSFSLPPSLSIYSPALRAGDPPGKPFLFLEGGKKKSASFHRTEGQILFWIGCFLSLAKGLLTAEMTANSLAMRVYICLRPKLCKTLTVEPYFIHTTAQMVLFVAYRCTQQLISAQIFQDL